MDYFKSYLENFYRKRIQQTKTSSVDSENVGIPIMKITSDHNSFLKLLRECYEKKLKELESVNFT